MTPSRRRPVVSYWHDAYRVSERRACRVARMAVSTFRYESSAGAEDGTAAADEVRVSAAVVAMETAGHAGSLAGNFEIGVTDEHSLRASVVAHPLKTAKGGAAS